MRGAWQAMPAKFQFTSNDRRQTMTAVQGQRGARKRGIPMPDIDYSKKNGVQITEEDIRQAAMPIVTATLTLQRERDQALAMVDRLQDEVRELRGRLNNVLQACLDAAKA